MLFQRKVVQVKHRHVISVIKQLLEWRIESEVLLINLVQLLFGNTQLIEVDLEGSDETVLSNEDKWYTSFVASRGVLRCFVVIYISSNNQVIEGTPVSIGIQLFQPVSSHFWVQLHEVFIH